MKIKELMTRNEFLKTMASASIAVAGVGTAASFTEACAAQPKAPNMHGLELGASVYSYTQNFMSGVATLEKCMADIADMGGKYVEIIGEAHIPGYPNPSTEWVDNWFKLLEKYDLKPSAYDTFCDTMWYRDRLLTIEELLELMTNDFRLANQLGFKVFRQLHAPYPPDDPGEAYLAPYVKSEMATKFLELVLPTCEKYDVKLGLELHAPTRLKSPWIDSMLELIERTKTKYLGFCPDFGSFTWRPAEGTVERMVQQGAKKEIVEYIIKAYQEDLGPDKTAEEVKKMGGGEIELNYASKSGLFHSSNNNPKDIKIVAPYIYHTHAKFTNILDDLSSDYSINYSEILKAYVENGVTGVLSSECEGRRTDITIPTHIRMHHAMERRILAAL
jgi:sugar phosphate isomerase/epimerase